MNDEADCRTAPATPGLLIIKIQTCHSLQGQENLFPDPLYRKITFCLSPHFPLLMKKTLSDPLYQPSVTQLQPTACRQFLAYIIVTQLVCFRQFTAYSPVTHPQLTANTCSICSNRYNIYPLKWPKYSFSNSTAFQKTESINKSGNFLARENILEMSNSIYINFTAGE